MASAYPANPAVRVVHLAVVPPGSRDPAADVRHVAWLGDPALLAAAAHIGRVVPKNRRHRQDGEGRRRLRYLDEAARAVRGWIPDWTPYAVSAVLELAASGSLGLAVVNAIPFPGFDGEEIAAAVRRLVAAWMLWWRQRRARAARAARREAMERARIESDAMVVRRPASANSAAPPPRPPLRDQPPIRPTPPPTAPVAPPLPRTISTGGFSTLSPVLRATVRPPRRRTTSARHHRPLAPSIVPQFSWAGPRPPLEPCEADEVEALP
ncbi:hypothetical protein BC828DRAFT_391741 [Blastocladiella britannica]|nr:hypothetical protein BC828DRAFT_391741 [Blastocladiella britannica]